MTKWSIFDKIEEAKKSTVLSRNYKIEHFDKIEEAKKSMVLLQNDKIEHFWQSLKREKYTRAFSENDKI